MDIEEVAHLSDEKIKELKEKWKNNQELKKQRDIEYKLKKDKIDGYLEAWPLSNLYRTTDEIGITKFLPYINSAILILIFLMMLFK